MRESGHLTLLGQCKLVSNAQHAYIASETKKDWHIHMRIGKMFMHNAKN